MCSIKNSWSLACPASPDTWRPLEAGEEIVNNDFGSPFRMVNEGIDKVQCRVIALNFGDDLIGEIIRRVPTVVASDWSKWPGHSEQRTVGEPITARATKNALLREEIREVRSISVSSCDGSFLGGSLDADLSEL